MYQPVGSQKRAISRTKEHIIHIASKIMHLRGYNHTSIEDVLKESGVGKGNFYYYFKSKEELGFAILEDNLTRFSESVLRKAFGDGEKDGLAQVDEFLDIIVDLHRQQNCSGGCPLGNMAMELSDIHEGFRKRFQRVFESWRLQLAAVLQDAKVMGRLSDQVDTTVLAQFIVATVQGGILLIKVKKDIRILENCFGELKKHIRIYLNGYPIPAQ